MTTTAGPVIGRSTTAAVTVVTVVTTAGLVVVVVVVVVVLVVLVVVESSQPSPSAAAPDGTRPRVSAVAARASEPAIVRVFLVDLVDLVCRMTGLPRGCRMVAPTWPHDGG